jgi:hypothetical protein
MLQINTQTSVKQNQINGMGDFINEWESIKEGLKNVEIIFTIYPRL